MDTTTWPAGRAEPAPTTPTSPAPGPAGSQLRPLVLFGAVAVPTGWVLLSIPVLLDLPVSPFVIPTLLLGLVLPALVLSRRDPATSARTLLRDTVRRPRPLLAAIPAVAVLPAAVWLVARALGVAEHLDAALLAGLAVNIGSSVVIINLWEEMAWTGFFQRRAMARWGTAAGSLVTAALFVAVHLPLAFALAEDAGDVLAGLAVLVVSGIGMRLLVAGTDAWSGHSIVAVALLHAGFNAAADVVDPGHDRVRYLVTLGLGLLALTVLTARSRTGGGRS